jgi:hypothetical protein
MDRSQFLNLKSNYEQMSDDEIAYLVSTRWEGLTVEAKTALVEVSRSRNQELIVEEVRATLADLGVQSEYDKRTEKISAQSESLRNVVALGIYCGALILVITGLLVAATKDFDRGLATAGTGVTLAGIYMAFQLLRKFMRAVFSR